MNKFLTLLITLTIVFAGKINAQTAYYQLYPKECYEAKNFYNEHKKQIEKAAKSVNLQPEMFFAIVAPEFTQYSYLSNKLETYSLKVLYVQFGKSYSDFSIGCFQMKPSFIELLEKTIAADENLKPKYDSCLFVNPDEREARVARIDRLNTIEWQIFYLTVFCDILQKRFNNLTFSTTDEKLRFYATAYNCGFHKTEQKIKETEQKALFPHFSTQKFKYSDIAVWFFRELIELTNE